MAGLAILLFLSMSLVPMIGPVAPALTAAQQATYVVKPTCTDSLQAQIDASPPGSTLAVRTDCVYREAVDVDIPIILDGQGEAEIRGSDIWDQWTSLNGIWISDAAVPWFETDGFCDPLSDGRCLWPEQVFRDGEALRQVPAGTTPGPGQFSLDGSRRIMVADDPTIAVMEVTVRETWMTVRADDVTVGGFTMKHAASDAQRGALMIELVSGWLVQDNVLSDAHSSNLTYHATTHDTGQILNNELFNGGQLGVGGDRGDGVVVRGNVIHHNNTEAFSTVWEAGGAKFLRADNMLIEDNIVYENEGHGIWLDIDCFDVIVRNNAVHHNKDLGILFELSDGGEITGNTIWENNWNREGDEWAGNAGIIISSSRNARVYDNVVAWNLNGIVVVSQCRVFFEGDTECDFDQYWNRVYGIEIHDNAIVMSGEDVPGADRYASRWIAQLYEVDGEPYRYMFTDDAENQGYGNAYWLPDTGNSFEWDGATYDDLQGFSETRGESDAVILTVDERDQILTEAGIPLAPDAP